jgi:hypothetical protein
MHFAGINDLERAYGIAQAAQRFLALDPIDLNEVRDIIADIVADDMRARIQDASGSFPASTTEGPGGGLDSTSRSPKKRHAVDMPGSAAAVEAS